MLKIRRALISVSDKTGIVELGQTLASLKVEIVSTGGTASMLKAAGIPVIEMAQYTGFPEMLDGRLKSLHPKIHGGLLSVRANAEHMKQIKEHQIGLIDMVVVNLYPFEETIKKDKTTLAEAIENIDIGGPSMLRSAAKNYQSVAVVPHPRFYQRIIKELRAENGCLSHNLLKELAVEVFKLTARYDSVIAGFLRHELGADMAPDDPLPDVLSVTLTKTALLRYGENPHQRAALYRLPENVLPSLVNAKQLHGKELSFNNYLDLNAALGIVRDFSDPAACIVKHSNPTGVACAHNLVSAFRQALDTDPLSAFGGIIGLNKTVDAVTARAIQKAGFMECVIAPSYQPQAIALLTTKKNLRLLELRAERTPAALDFKKIDGGILVQEEDAADFKEENLKVVTRRKPNKKEMLALLFAWKVVKHVKSNAIVLASGTKTVGVGMGQTSRVDSVFMAIKRAGSRSRGSVMASDAFFPKEDNIALARRAGVRAIIQPGGSVADEDVIRACDRSRIAMVFTGIRHFKH